MKVKEDIINKVNQGNEVIGIIGLAISKVLVPRLANI